MEDPEVISALTERHASADEVRRYFERLIVSYIGDSVHELARRGLPPKLKA